jgi:hypothetical protein
MKRSLLWAALLVGSAALFGYSLYRAVHLSFVHDESLTYSILAGDPFFRDTANHHPLNTRAMEWTRHWIGDLEWSLRLPNVLAHLLYLASGLLLLRKVQNSFVVLFGFALLNLNPFMLEFFALARGYGIALGFSLASLWLFGEAWDRPATAVGRAAIFLSFTFAALAGLANFGWLNFHVAMLAGGFVFWLLDYRLSGGARRTSLIIAVVFFGANIWSIINVARRVMWLHARGEIYLGGTRGFIPDTIGSLAGTYLYDAAYASWGAALFEYAIPAIFVVLGLVVIQRLVRRHKAGFPETMWGILACSVLLVVAEHHLLEAPFPQDRFALYYVPIFAVTLLSMAGDLTVPKGIGARLLSLTVSIFTVAMILHLASTANLRGTFIWYYDADTKTAMSDLQNLVGENPRQMSIGSDWQLSPTINYYRISRKYDWLEPSTREGPTAKFFDVVLCAPENLGDAAERYSVVKSYPRTGLSLFVARSDATR